MPASWAKALDRRHQERVANTPGAWTGASLEASVIESTPCRRGHSVSDVGDGTGSGRGASWNRAPHRAEHEERETP